MTTDERIDFKTHVRVVEIALNAVMKNVSAAMKASADAIESRRWGDYQKAKHDFTMLYIKLEDTVKACELAESAADEAYEIAYEAADERDSARLAKESKGK